MDALKFYESVSSEINKEENGYLPASLFNTLALKASTQHFNDNLYALQDPQTKNLQEIKDRLMPFHELRAIDVVNGYFDRPENYAGYGSCRANYTDLKSLVSLNYYQSKICEAVDDPTIDVEEYRRKIDAIYKNPELVDVTLLDVDQLAQRRNSSIRRRRPRKTKPVIERYENGFKIYPAENDMNVILGYYRRPVPGIYATKINDVTLAEEYDPVNSTAWEWPDEAMEIIVDIMVTKFSIHTREKDLFQMKAVEKSGK